MIVGAVDVKRWLLCWDVRTAPCEGYVHAWARERAYMHATVDIHAIVDVRAVVGECAFLGMCACVHALGLHDAYGHELASLLGDSGWAQQKRQEGAAGMGSTYDETLIVAQLYR